MVLVCAMNLSRDDLDILVWSLASSEGQAALVLLARRMVVVLLAQCMWTQCHELGTFDVAWLCPCQPAWSSSLNLVSSCHLVSNQAVDVAIQPWLQCTRPSSMPSAFGRPAFRLAIASFGAGALLFCFVVLCLLP